MTARNKKYIVIRNKKYMVIRIIRKRFDKKIMPYSKVNNISNIRKKRRDAYRDAQRDLIRQREREKKNLQ